MVLGGSLHWIFQSMLPRPFMPVMMTIRFPALSRFARFREPAVISNRKVTTCFAPCRPKSERPPRLISVTIFGRIQHHPKGFVSASPVLSLTMARVQGRLLRIRPCSLAFVCECVRSPLLFRCGSGDVGLKRKRKRKTERGKERSLKFCIESFGKAVRRVSELAVRRVDFCDFFAGFG